MRGDRSLWVAATGRTFFTDGRAVRLVGTVQDITERVRAAAERKAAEEASGRARRS